MNKNGFKNKHYNWRACPPGLFAHPYIHLNISFQANLSLLLTDREVGEMAARFEKCDVDESKESFYI